jgi:hypothetical protein
MRSRWILRYLNSRYFRFPDGIAVKAREGWELPRTNTRHNFLRAVDGQNAWLEENAAAKGSVELSDARAHWWIIKEEVDRDSGHFAPGGHVAALYENELYEMLHGRAGTARLQAFGAIFGTDRVVIYIEPKSDIQRVVTSNTARTQLLVAGDPLDWARWSAEFREQLPDEIIELQQEIGSRAGEKDYKKKILERLKEIKDLLRFSRYRPSKNGSASIEPDSNLTGGEPAVNFVQHDGHANHGSKGGKAGNIYSLFAESGGLSGEAVDSMNEPIVIWQSTDEGTRTIQDGLENRAARFLLQQNTLVINADFRVFRDMIDRWTRFYGHVAGARDTIKEVVHEWFEQQLLETLLSAIALKSTGRWSFDELEKLWTEEALTTAVLPRWHIDQSIKRNLGQRLGSLKSA